MVWVCVGGVGGRCDMGEGAVCGVDWCVDGCECGHERI